jgi:hypothetical protein
MEQTRHVDACRVRTRVDGDIEPSTVRSSGVNLACLGRKPLAETFSDEFLGVYGSAFFVGLGFPDALCPSRVFSRNSEGAIR